MVILEFLNTMLSSVTFAKYKIMVLTSTNVSFNKLHTVLPQLITYLILKANAFLYNYKLIFGLLRIICWKLLSIEEYSAGNCSGRYNVLLDQTCV